MTISKEVAQAILDVDRPYTAPSVVPLRQLCGDQFVDDAIDLARDKGDLGHFDQCVRQLAREVLEPEIVRIVGSARSSTRNKPSKASVNSLKRKTRTKVHR